ncbi:hypothetical protein SSX86_018879 [Deinandra increscens subsp. villosa]|uniref:Protein SIEVE ELEMENT OCCLUSION B-like n=1 Tax=Deinandra increscens subsp. villosa TaxID=3103831 RepID=A0AAP0GTY2_9ASTR
MHQIFSASDDNVIMKQVLDTHLPDGTDVDVKPLVHIVEEILRHATINATIDADSTSMVAHIDVGKLNAVLILDSVSHVIDNLARELALILRAFAQIYSSNQLAKSMAIRMEQSAPLEPRFDALNKLIHSVIKLTWFIMQFNEMPYSYVSDVAAFARALQTIPTAVYWSVRGIIACAAQITSLTSMEHEYGISSSEMQSWELSTLILKMTHLLEFLKKQWVECHRVIEEMAFRHSFNQLFETLHIDNMRILKTMFNSRDDPLPLFDGATKKRVSFEVLRRRNVLLLISGLDMSREELSILEQIYSESRSLGSRMDALYELVWVPMVDHSIEYMDIQFDDMRNNMPWYSVYHLSKIDRVVKKSIGDRWNYSGKPILVVLDPQGKELSPNAMHMMWIWGNTAFPFTTAREEALWRNETWRLELLVSGMDATILDWAKQDKYIFLYGGDDIEWIRKFTSNAHAMATAARIPLQMPYVGKSKEKESVRRAIVTINVENLSYYWHDTTQIEKLLSYDKDGSWALLCRGSQILTIGHGPVLLQTLADFDLWKERIPTMGFDLSFKDYYDKLYGAANMDDDVIKTQVLDTHHSDGTDVDVKTLVYIADQILMAPLRKLEGKSRKTNAHQNAVLTLNSLSHIIDKLACEMSRKRSSEKDLHTTTLYILHTVRNFQWEAKLALILACFALNHGEFWLLPQIMELSAPLKRKFDALTKLAYSVLESTRCIIQLKGLPSTHLSAGVPAMDAAINSVPSAVYWNVRGIISCAVQITGFTSLGHETSSSEMQSWEQSSLILKINELLEFLKRQLEECNRVIEDRKDMDFRHSFNRLFKEIHNDNMEILEVLINSRDDPLPLFDGTTKKKVSLDVLRRKNVLLLISGLDVSREELVNLTEIYMMSRVQQGSRMIALYELVWIPIVDAMDKKFEDTKNSMPWYSVHNPSYVDMVVRKSIGDRWNFRSKPILVVLDPQGKELNRNAIHMMWIWGFMAFPFTTDKEEALWRDETWSLNLILAYSGIDITVYNWVREDKYIFLYGGDNIEWIRKFTNNVQAMATAAHIPLEMAYVGKSNTTQKVQRAIETISVQKLSYYLPDTMVRSFWTRLKSILFSKIQLKGAEDPIMRHIKKLLSYEKKGSWALIGRGSQFPTIGHGSTMLQTTADFDLWKEHIPTKGFDLSFKEYHDKLHAAANKCCRVEFPNEAAGIPEDMGCPECSRVMGKHISFLCCHD